MESVLFAGHIGGNEPQDRERYSILDRDWLISTEGKKFLKEMFPEGDIARVGMYFPSLI